MSNILKQVMGNNDSFFINQIKNFGSHVNQRGINPQNELDKMRADGRLNDQQYKQAVNIALNIARRFFGYKG